MKVGLNVIQHYHVTFLLLVIDDSLTIFRLGSISLFIIALQLMSKGSEMVESLGVASNTSHCKDLDLYTV